MDLTGAVRRKSSYSGSNGAACVEVASVGAAVVRDSKHPDGPKLAFPAGQWQAFTDQVKAGAFDQG